jgi:hypothetical protein
VRTAFDTQHSDSSAQLQLRWRLSAVLAIEVSKMLDQFIVRRIWAKVEIGRFEGSGQRCLRSQLRTWRRSAAARAVRAFGLQDLAAGSTLRLPSTARSFRQSIG